MPVVFSELKVDDIIESRYGRQYRVLASTDVAAWIISETGLEYPFTVVDDTDGWTKVVPKFEVGGKYFGKVSQHVYECVRANDDRALIVREENGGVYVVFTPSHEAIRNYEKVG